MRKDSNIMRIAAIFLTLTAALALTSCGGSQESDAPKNQSQDSNGGAANNNPGIDAGKSQENTGNTGTSSSVTKVFPAIPASGVEVTLGTQLVSAMAILPETALTRSENNQDPLLAYNNIGKLLKIYGIKKGGIPQDKQQFLSYCPIIFSQLSAAPLNQIEEVTNWYWTASHPSTGSTWLAGDMALDATLMPAIKDLRYEEKAYPGTGMSVYIQTTEGMNPLYGKIIVPLGKDLCYFNLMPTDPSLANDTFRNLNIEKTLGLLGKSQMKNLLSLCGDPEQMILVSPRKKASGLLGSVPEQLKKDFAETLKNIKDVERHPGLMSVAVCYDRALEYPLRFVFGYENQEQVEEDFPKLASIWGKAGKGYLDWAKTMPQTSVRFSKSLTCGIVECKPDKKVSPPAVTGSFLMMIQGGFMPELWLR